MKSNILMYGFEIIKDHKLLQLVESHACFFLQTDPSRLDHDIREQEIDLVVFEFSFGWQENLKILQSIKLSFPKVPIIVVSGGHSTDEVIRSFQFGARDHFKKPYQHKLLAERIQALVRDRVSL